MGIEDSASKDRVTPLGCDTILIDDPYDADSAPSDAERKSVLEKYEAAITARLKDQVRGGTLIIMSRFRKWE